MSLHCWQGEPAFSTVPSAGKPMPSKCFFFLLAEINRKLEVVKVSRKSCGCLILYCPLAQSLYDVLPLLMAVSQLGWLKQGTVTTKAIVAGLGQQCYEWQ